MSPATRQALQTVARSGLVHSSLLPQLASSLLQVRPHGGGVPEFYGKPSPYSSGSGFLGTPPDHLERVAKRPVSPHVFEIDGKGMHYRMPINAISSIVNRATGVALSVGATGAGWVALTGDLPAAVEAFKGAVPWMVVPAKAVVAFPLVYHYFGGFRHILWDKATIGKQAEHKSLLEKDRVDSSSKLIVALSVVGTLGLALYSI